MPKFRPRRHQGKGTPGPQTWDDPGAHPRPAPGQPPEPNEAQTGLGTGYTVLRGGQDVQQPGLYFDEATQEVRYYRRGQTIGHAATADPWIYLTEERAAPLDRVTALIRERGYGGPLDRLRIRR
ncbi:MAG TPA: hypothetical protein VIO14_07630 [Dehalococcoidia bacterium]